MAEAEEFLRLFHRENPQAGIADRRLAAVQAEVQHTGSYTHTVDELTFGARVAWRNSARCIGRLYWKSLRVRDLRSERGPERIAQLCVEHLRLAGNGGRIRPLISVFAPNRPGNPGPRVHNEQLIRYAGYGDLGDPRQEAFTVRALDLGWRPPAERTAFDPLPLVISDGGEPQLFPLHPDDVHEVRLSHPEYAWFAELGLRWHAVPAISDMRLSVGGIDYPAAPFNGWYLGTEIGARNLLDRDRYDLAEQVAERLGLDRSSERTLWRDRVLVEVNRAVLHSFEAAGVTMADHHTEAERFLTHVAREEAAGRSCPADWSWIVPPMSGSLTPVFHRYYDGEVSGPRFRPPEG